MRFGHFSLGISPALISKRKEASCVVSIAERQASKPVGLSNRARMLLAPSAPEACMETVMSEQKPLEFLVDARRVDSHGSVAHCKNAQVTLDTDLAGRTDTFNPAELLLAALSACIIKSIERVSPMIKFQYRGVDVHMHGVRQDVPPKMVRIDYEVMIDSDEDDHRLTILHDNVRKFGTVYNTVAAGTELKGTIRRKVPGALPIPAALG